MEQKKRKLFKYEIAANKKAKHILTKGYKEEQLKKQAKKQAKIDMDNFVKKIKERDNYTCQISNKNFKNAAPQALQMAHILSKENYPELMLNENNVICISFHHHKNSSISSHLDGFVFTRWLQINRPKQYKFLMKYLDNCNKP